MSLAHIRAFFETHLTTNFVDMDNPPDAIVYDNVQETLQADPSQDWVLLSISFPQISEPTICSLQNSGVDAIRGNIQVSCYSPRGVGMLRVEELASVAAAALGSVNSADDPNNVRPRVGSIEGPQSIGTGYSPYMLSVVSAPFTAKG